MTQNSQLPTAYRVGFADVTLSAMLRVYLLATCSFLFAMEADYLQAQEVHREARPVQDPRLCDPLWAGSLGAASENSERLISYIGFQRESAELVVVDEKGVLITFDLPQRRLRQYVTISDSHSAVVGNASRNALPPVWADGILYTWDQDCSLSRPKQMRMEPVPSAMLTLGTKGTFVRSWKAFEMIESPLGAPLQTYDRRIRATVLSGSEDLGLLAIGTLNGTVMLLDVESGKVLLEEHSFGEAISHVVCSGDPTTQLLFSTGARILKVDVRKKSRAQPLKTAEDATRITALAVAASGGSFLLARQSGRVEVYQDNSDRPHWTRIIAGDFVTAAAFSEERDLIALGTCFGSVYLIDAQTGCDSWPVEGHTVPVTAVASSATDPVYVTADMAGTVIWWDSVSRREILRIANVGCVPAQIIVLPGRSIVFRGKNAFGLLDTHGKLTDLLRDEFESPVSMAYDNENGELIVVNTNGNLYSIKMSNDHSRRLLSCAQSSPNAQLCLSPDSRALLVIDSNECQIRACEPTLRILQSVKLQEGEKPRLLGSSERGFLIASEAPRPQLFTLQTAGGKPRTVTPKEQVQTAVQIDSGEWIAVGDARQVWLLSDHLTFSRALGRCRHGLVRCVAFDSRTGLVLLGTQNGAVLLLRPPL